MIPLTVIGGYLGAGKTTLVKLLCKMYEPTEGRILVDGTDLARIPAEEWRERLAGDLIGRGLYPERYGRGTFEPDQSTPRRAADAYRGSDRRLSGGPFSGQHFQNLRPT